MDPKYINPEVTAKCLEVAHRCSGIFCGCTCHGADRAQSAAMLAQETTNMRAHHEQLQRGIAEAEAGQTVDLGSFAEHLDERIEIKLPDLSRVALEPGDTLLVRVPRNLTMKDAADIHTRFQRYFPGHDVVVVAKDLELSVVRPVPGKVADDGSA